MKKTSHNRKHFIEGEDLDKTNLNSINNLSNLNIDADDSIESMFRNEQNAMQNDVKELFHEDKVKARTDLSTRQIKLITKAFYLAKLTGIKEVNQLLADFMTLSISKDRKSRQEYVEGLKSKIDNAIQQGTMNIRGQFGK
jgi:hypothetical protein